MGKVAELVDVGKIYRMGRVDVPALRGVTLSVYEGEFLCVAGPSGSGKSTLLNILGLLDRPSWGKVIFLGKNVADLSEREIEALRRKIGFVYQFYNLFPELTVFENVEYPLKLRGIKKGERKRRVAEVLEALGITELKDRRPHDISGGEQQRVAIARALVIEPILLLADEPTADIDSETGKLVIRQMKQACKERGVATVVATHDPIVIGEADRVVHLRDGVIRSELRPNL